MSSFKLLDLRQGALLPQDLGTTSSALGSGKGGTEISKQVTGTVRGGAVLCGCASMSGRACKFKLTGKQIHLKRLGTWPEGYRARGQNSNS